MELSEKELEDIVFRSDNDLLQDRGLWIYGKKVRQLNLFGYGIADIVTFEREYNSHYEVHQLTITVWELKKDCVDVQTLLQACRYIKGIKRIIEKYEHKIANIAKKFDTIEYKVCLLGTKVDWSKDFLYILDLVEDEKICMYSCSYDLNGINFKSQSEIIRSNEGF